MVLVMKTSRRQLWFESCKGYFLVLAGLEIMRIDR